MTVTSDIGTELGELTGSITSEGQIRGCMDTDTHEMIPLHMWSEAFGDVVDEFTKICRRMNIIENNASANKILRPDITADATEITPDSVWEVKGPDAPGSFDFSRRLAVMDAQGVERQLVFPGFALRGMILLYDPQADLIFEFDRTEVDMDRMGRQCIDAHNDWCIRNTKLIGADRMRIVGFVMVDDVDTMMREAEHLLAGGLRALMLPSGVPPAGMSPADRRLDPFWKLMSDAKASVLMHVGTEFGMMSSRAWSAGVPEFENSLGSSLEFVLQPYWASTVNFASENYLTAMVLGGVFERHPDLRFGSIEVGARWIGPFAERLDQWADVFHRRFYDNKNFSMKPSGYINRNVRVAPFHFEDVGSCMERYPSVVNSFCFSSDYPHVEGGQHPKKRFLESLRHLSDQTIHDFFVTNGEWLMPALE